MAMNYGSCRDCNDKKCSSFMHVFVQKKSYQIKQLRADSLILLAILLSNFFYQRFTSALLIIPTQSESEGIIQNIRQNFSCGAKTFRDGHVIDNDDKNK